VLVWVPGILLQITYTIIVSLRSARPPEHVYLCAGDGVGLEPVEPDGCMVTGGPHDRRAETKSRKDDPEIITAGLTLNPFRVLRFVLLS
jgi:hypothetical protein